MTLFAIYLSLAAIVDVQASVPKVRIPIIVHPEPVLSTTVNSHYSCYGGNTIGLSLRSDENSTVVTNFIFNGARLPVKELNKINEKLGKFPNTQKVSLGCLSSGAVLNLFGLVDSKTMQEKFASFTILDMTVILD